MDTWWKNFIYQEYKSPDAVHIDVTRVCVAFRDLCPGVDTCVLENGTQKQLLTLSGTIPVNYKDQTYNIPISVWIMTGHPHKPPCVFVRPTDTMQIIPNKHVSDRGKVNLPYLHDWKYPDCDLLSLVQVLSFEFGERCPVFGKVHKSFATNAESDYRQRLFPGLSKQYQHPEQVRKEMLHVQKYFPDLRPDFSVYATNTRSPKELQCLEGTIPVDYKGNQYNIPICLWIMPGHPAEPPDVSVCPTSTMRINPNETVDIQGRVTLQYLQEWNQTSSDLLTLVRILCSIFGQVSPVFSLVKPDGNLLAFHEDKRFITQYQDPDLTKMDVWNAVEQFSQLKPKFDWVVESSGGSQMELLNLEGTIPVPYKGNSYNIPICIWLHGSHPHVAPEVYVRPTSTMVISANNYINSEGKLDLPCLQQWKYPGSNLLTLIDSLVNAFSKESPVFAKLPSKDQPHLFPQMWTDTDSDKLIFPMNETSKEFIDVRNDFLSSLHSQGVSVVILKIDRIQNKKLYQQYQIEKQSMDKENPGQCNERSLWHGTADKAIRNINRNGFNRSYCGKNATVYGQGVYFAVLSSYSTCNTYSPPDSQGVKYIYRAKVLTGRFTRGNPSMRDTPLLDPTRSLRYHSTTDNVRSPLVFASFRDVHSYPEYLIAFRMSSN